MEKNYKQLVENFIGYLLETDKRSKEIYEGSLRPNEQRIIVKFFGKEIDEYIETGRIGEQEQPQTTAKERVEIELRELREKGLKLHNFIAGDGRENFLKLSKINKMLLEAQEPAMEVYCRILEARLAVWED